MNKYHKTALEEPQLCPMDSDLLMLEHKPQSASGHHTRAITLHNILCAKFRFLLFCTKFWLQRCSAIILYAVIRYLLYSDWISWLCQQPCIAWPATGNKLKLATFDIVALYPSINLDSERGLKSLKWFLETECDFSEQLWEFILVLAWFVLTHCYVACPEITTYIFDQVIGTVFQWWIQSFIWFTWRLVFLCDSNTVLVSTQDSLMMNFVLGTVPIKKSLQRNSTMLICPFRWFGLFSSYPIQPFSSTLKLEFHVPLWLNSPGNL